MRFFLPVFVILLLLCSCASGEAPSPRSPAESLPSGPVSFGEAPGSPSAAAPSSSPLPEEEAAAPEDPLAGVDEDTAGWAFDFLRYFCLTPFDSPEEIPPRDVYWFAFTRIAQAAWEANSQQVMAVLEENRQMFPIPREEAEEEIARTFGLSDLPYEGDVEYDPERDAYLYPFAHGEPDVFPVFLEFREGEDSIVICLAEISPQWEAPRTYLLSFTFRVTEENGELSRQAVSLSSREAGG
jgi:hypothetical protein